MESHSIPLELDFLPTLIIIHPRNLRQLGPWHTSSCFFETASSTTTEKSADLKHLASAKRGGWTMNDNGPRITASIRVSRTPEICGLAEVRPAGEM